MAETAPPSPGGRRLQIKVASSPIIAGNFGEVIFSPTFKLYDGLVLDLVAFSPTVKKGVKKVAKRKRNDGRTDVIQDGQVMWKVKFIKGLAEDCDEMSTKRTKYFLKVETVKECTRSSEHCSGIMEFMGKPKSQKSFRGQKLRKGSFIPGVDNLGFRCHCTSSVRKGHHRCESYVWSQNGKMLSNPFSIRGRPTGSKRPKEDSKLSLTAPIPGVVALEGVQNIRIPSPAVPGNVLGSGTVKRMISPMGYMYNQGVSAPATPSSTCSTVRLTDDSNQRTPSPQYFTSVPPPFRADNNSTRSTPVWGIDDKSNDSMHSQAEDYKLYRPVATDSRYHQYGQQMWPSQQQQQLSMRQPPPQPHLSEHKHLQTHQPQPSYQQIHFHSSQQQQPMHIQQQPTQPHSTEHKQLPTHPQPQPTYQQSHFHQPQQNQAIQSQQPPQEPPTESLHPNGRQHVLHQSSSMPQSQLQQHTALQQQLYQQQQQLQIQPQQVQPQQRQLAVSGSRQISQQQHHSDVRQSASEPPQGLQQVRAPSSQGNRRYTSHVVEGHAQQTPAPVAVHHSFSMQTQHAQSYKYIPGVGVTSGGPPASTNMNNCDAGTQAQVGQQPSSKMNKSGFGGSCEAGGVRVVLSGASSHDSCVNPPLTVESDIDQKERDFAAEALCALVV